MQERWKIAQVELLESGRERGTLWVRIAGERSRIDLSISLCRNRPAVDVQARVFWAERSARLKLRFPVGDEAEFEVPGAVVKRGPCGEVPGGKWVAVNSRFGLASDALYNFDAQAGVLSATVVRASRYADDVPTPAESQPWLPATDLGELKFRFLVTVKPKLLPDLARELEQPPVVQLVPAGQGRLPRLGSLVTLEPASLELLAIKRAEETADRFVLRVQGPPEKAVQGRLDWMGTVLELGAVKSGQIASWLLEPAGAGWKAVPVDLSEEPRGKSVGRKANGVERKRHR